MTRSVRERIGRVHLTIQCLELNSQLSKHARDGPARNVTYGLDKILPAHLPLSVPLADNSDKGGMVFILDGIRLHPHQPPRHCCRHRHL